MRIKAVVNHILVALMAISIFPCLSHAQVGVKISIKFILDQNGNRPATGNMNTDADIRFDVDQGTRILRDVITEFALDRIHEVIDLPGLSNPWFTATADIPTRDALRTAAIANPTAFSWRTDALNVYVNGGIGSAVSDFPPNNNIILVNQSCGNTPSCFLHEIGHSLNLFHTHEPGGDQCVDTLPDKETSSKDQLSLDNFGQIYVNLTPAQREQVDMTYNNIMSYHTDEPQRRISPCQMNRSSTQGYIDRNRLYSRIPIYVKNTSSSPTEDGSFENPFRSLQGALNAGGLANRALVLEQGGYTMSQSTINADVHMLPRSAPSQVIRATATALPQISGIQSVITQSEPTANPQGVKRYSLPVDLENSQNPQVRIPVRAVQNDDTAARVLMRDAAEAARAAVRQEDKDAILAAAEARRKQLQESAVNHLLEAEQYASGDEKLALQWELAQRYRDSADFELAVKYYKLVAETTDQQYLKEEALRLAEKYSQELLKQKQR